MAKEIVDRESIQKVLNLLFGRLPVYILDNGRQYPIKVISLSSRGLIVSHNRNLQSEDRILTLTHNGMKFKTFLKYLGGNHQNYEVLFPLKIQIEEAERQSNRIEIRPGQSQVTISKTINQTEILKALGFDDDKVDRILQKFQSRLRLKFDSANIYISPRMDNRLRMMQNFDKPIFVPDRREPNSVSRAYFPYEEYLRLIQVVKLEERFQSEISVPIKYKGYTPMGYVQVLGESPLNNDSFDLVCRVAEAISREIISTGIFQESQEICDVSDLSRTGLSFLHPQSRFFSRSFSVGEVILFELQLPDSLKAMVRGMIKNIKNMETKFRVGVEFYNLTLHDYRMIESYIEKKT